MKYVPRKYQMYTTSRIISDPINGLLLDMGLGKTVSSLTAINDLIFDYLSTDKWLVVAPKRVAQTVWTDEILKWDHLKHLKISQVLGTERQRKEALKAKADIYIINRDNVAWLVTYYQSAWPFKNVVLDELSSFKSHDSVRFKSLRLVRPYMERVVGLTGTPATNGLMGLWSQMYLLDQGQRLGKFYTHYRDRFFESNKYSFKWKPKEGAEEKIYELISDICVSMKAEDYLELPGVTEQLITVRLSDQEMARYENFERDRILEIKDVNRITVSNAGIMAGKLLQYANGAIYDENKDWHEVHTAKIEAIVEAVEALNGKPVIIAYSYQHDKERLKKALKAFNPRVLEKPKDIEDWNKGKIQVFLMHPASGGHGLNLQFGGHHLFWFGQNWDLELEQQLNKRLDRPGQDHRVIIVKFVTEGTMDMDVIPAMRDKSDVQEALLKALKVRIEKYKSYEK
jgi:SNF2 family DNA or RNA helicase